VVNCGAGITYNCGSSIGGSGNCVCGAADKYADMEPDIREETEMNDIIWENLVKWIK